MFFFQKKQQSLRESKLFFLRQGRVRFAALPQIQDLGSLCVGSQALLIYLAMPIFLLEKSLYVITKNPFHSLT